jgi:hypothetical protein
VFGVLPSRAVSNSNYLEGNIVAFCPRDYYLFNERFGCVTITAPRLSSFIWCASEKHNLTLAFLNLWVFTTPAAKINRFSSFNHLFLLNAFFLYFSD